jgi:hypothetical protein
MLLHPTGHLSTLHKCVPVVPGIILHHIAIYNLVASTWYRLTPGCYLQFLSNMCLFYFLGNTTIQILYISCYQYYYMFWLSISAITRKDAGSQKE